MTQLFLTVERPGHSPETIVYPVKLILCLGFAGRDQNKVREHIHELEAIGVKCPTEVPVIYPVSELLATTASSIQVVGADTGPEVEFALISYQNRLLVGLASDHTDRDLEKVSIYKSKQICPKPLSSVFWDYEDVANHWDELVLRSWINTGAEEVLYQDSHVSTILLVPTIIQCVRQKYPDLEGIVILSGTIPTRVGLATPSKFIALFYDPVLSRGIRLTYEVKDLLRE